VKSTKENEFVVAPALCLDLDGTVRRSKSGQAFHLGPDDLELMPGIAKIIWMYRKMNFLILGISNQAGVSWGFKTAADVNAELAATFELFGEHNPFHLVKQCYHDGNGKVFPYNYRSLLRKPDIGMLALMEVEAFSADFIIDWDKSLFVGDRQEDNDCATRAGVKFIHIDSFLTMPHEFKI
jgi:histidinol phosphatase-like enzyme